MKSFGWIVAFWVDIVGLGQAPRLALGPNQLERVNRQLHGKLLDFTNNHGRDRRLWSPSLGQKRDLYVYLPPGFDPHKRYPFILWLHGFAQEEASFLRDVVMPLDKAIGTGIVPPVIMA